MAVKCCRCHRIVDGESVNAAHSSSSSQPYLFCAPVTVAVAPRCFVAPALALALAIALVLVLVLLFAITDVWQNE